MVVGAKKTHGTNFNTRQTLRYLSPGSELTVELSCGGARGVVRHCEAWVEARGAAGFSLGVEFTDLSGD